MSDDLSIRCLVLKKNGDSYDLKPLDPKLDGAQVFGILAGKIHKAKLVPGDVVNVIMSGYFTRANIPIGRIVDRVKNDEEIAMQNANKQKKGKRR